MSGRMRTCVYCGKQKDEDKFTREHILPKGLIGTFDVQKQPFVIDSACAKCNNLSGFFVDAPAIKSWFINAEITSGANTYAVIEENPILPLHYMGVLRDVSFDSKICEAYIGPAEATIYHFHDPYPNLDSLPPMVGVPPSIRNKDYDVGFAFIFIATNNPVWFPTVILSFIDAFKDSILYCGNCENLPTEKISVIPDHLIQLCETLKSVNGRKRTADIKISPYSETRFLAKLALGFGSKLFGDEFIHSEDAFVLRKCMWGKTPEQRNAFPVHGTGFLTDHEARQESTQMFGMKGAHVIMLSDLAGAVGLTICLNNSVSASVKICNSKPHYKQILGDGVCYVIVPALRKVVGPHKLIEFLSYKFDMNIKVTELTSIEQTLRGRESKPSRII